MKNNKTNEGAVNLIVKTLKDIDVDGETMQEILKRVGMDDQMRSQLSCGARETLQDLYGNIDDDQLTLGEILEVIEQVSETLES